MPPKVANKPKSDIITKTATKKNLTPRSSVFGDLEADGFQSIILSVELSGDDCNIFIVLFGKTVVLETRWQDGLKVETAGFPLNFDDLHYESIIADTPLIFLLRNVGGKGSKEPDPMLHPDNCASANVDLSPLVLGQNEILVKVRLVSIATGEFNGCKVRIHARRVGFIQDPLECPKLPLLLTMISAHCLPVVKEGTVYVAAVGMNGLLESVSVNFGMSLSSAGAKKLAWATASTGGSIVDTAYNVPDEDRFIPEDLVPSDSTECNSVYWNVIKRVLVDPILLRDRLASPFLVEIAGIPKTGKVEVRGRYMGFIDAAVLLQSGQFGVTTCAKLKYYIETELPDDLQPLLEFPPSSAKTSARDRVTDILMDGHGHTAYVMLRLDVTEPLLPKTKLANLYETIGFSASEVPIPTVDELLLEPPAEDPSVDVRRIRKEGGALAVHKELSGLACRGVVPMNQGIKRTAANRLLVRVRTMLKQFSPGDCSYLDWQEAVTEQHAAARRAVTASFEPQPQPLRTTARVAAIRALLAGDKRIADEHASRNLKAAGNHPRGLLYKIIRCLEERSDREAKTYTLQALENQSRNRFLLWVYGGQEFAKGQERNKCARAAIRISVRGDHSDGTANAIGWAALHALHHYENNVYAAFVAVKRMRKAYELGKEWKLLLKRWTDASGQEEILWNPEVISSDNPMLIAAAFFLCLRCYDFSERLLQCFVEGCGTRGSRNGFTTEICSDVYYLRAASWLLRRQINKAMEVVQLGIRKFGPSANLSQMRAMCLAYARGWNGECEMAFLESERAGAESCPKLLLQAAVAVMEMNPKVALQRAARAHKIVPGAHSALIIGRIYDKLGEPELAQRWAAAAVKFEALLADGWAFLGLLAMRNRDVNLARTMLRSAKQAGPVSADLEEKIDKLNKVVKVAELPESMVKHLCLCDYY